MLKLVMNVTSLKYNKFQLLSYNHEATSARNLIREKSQSKPLGTTPLSAERYFKIQINSVVNGPVMGSTKSH